MSSATINSKANSSAAFAALEKAVTNLKLETAVLVKSTTRENGAPFSRVQVVWEAQKRLSAACSAAPVRGGDDLWPRVAVAKAGAEKALARSRRFHELWKRREDARRAHQGSRANGSGSHVSASQIPAPTAPGRWEFSDEFALVRAGVEGVFHAG